MHKITAEQLVHIAPSAVRAPNLAALVYSLNRAASRFQIDANPRRLRYFIAQLAYESMHFTATEENLFYTDPARVARIFRYGFDTNRNKRVDPEEIELARGYIRNPVALANRAYANRMGNRDEASGDGWRFHGRGFIQLTFAANYYRASMGLYGDRRLVDYPERVADKATYEDAAMTAGYFWSVNGLNELADADEFTRVTSAIHGAGYTVKERILFLRRANQAIA